MKIMNSRRGQAVIEFALTLPVVVLLIVGALDLGRLFFVKIIITNAAREGAYYLAYNEDDDSYCVDGVCYWGTITSTINEAGNSGVTLAPPNISISGCCTEGSPVSVTVTQTIDLTIIDFFSGPLTLSSTVRMLSQ